MELNIHGRSSTSTSTPSTPTTHLNSPIPITRSDPNSPYPTTFVTADSSSFKQVVQMLTGSDPNPNPNTHQPQTDPPSRNFVIPPIKPPSTKKNQQQLYERRNSLKNSLLMINPLPRHPQNASFSPRKGPPENLLSPSVLDFPALTLSPVTPLPAAAGEDSDKSSEEEERAIAEKGFYLHPSPLSTPRDAGAGEPQLLPLFPVTSPRVSDQN